MAAPVNLDDYQRLAARRLPRLVRDFLDGGADDERTLRWNREAFDRYGLTPRSLVDVAERSSATTVLGQPVDLPVVLGPTGLARFAHPDGEVAVARAAATAGTVYVGSIAGSRTLEDVAAATSAPLWFQLYLWKDRELVRSMVERAERAGYRALVLTVDVPVSGHRERDLRNGMNIPPTFRPSTVLETARHVRWVSGYLRGERLTYANLVSDGALDGGAFTLAEYVNTQLANPGATWEWLAWLREIWPHPIAVKGVLNPLDAVAAVDHGADGVVVSNHGGRQLDGALSTLEALPGVVEAVGDRAEVFLDGGVRRGVDVLTALALGARACFVGRPYWHGLAVGGQAGVEDVLRLLHEEVDRAQALLGLPDLATLAADPGAYVRRRS